MLQISRWKKRGRNALVIFVCYSVRLHLINIQSLPKISVPLVNMIKEDCEN